MSTEHPIQQRVDDAADAVGPVWPIHSFVTANPLSGFEDQPFEEAVDAAARVLGGRGYPEAATFRRALERGQIDRELLEGELEDRGYDAAPGTLLDRLESLAEADRDESDPVTDRVDHVVSKWLSAFLEEGKAHWPLPNREAGFYAVFRQVAPHDGDVPDEGLVADLPADPVATLESALDRYPEREWQSILEGQLAALPGWTGFVKQRAETAGEWQSAHPITLEGYLAVRLALLSSHDADLTAPTADAAADGTVDEIAAAFLAAWETSYREELVEAVTAQSESFGDDEPHRPDAQLVFCIDTRSEIFRRHLEDAGDYETHGYAGFFGVPMEHEEYDAEVSIDACPPILDAQHRVTEEPTDTEIRATYDRRSGIRETARGIVETLEANAATAYGYVESAGAGYGLALAARTLLPGRVYDLLERSAERVPGDHEFCQPSVEHLPLDEKVQYAANAFELMGWEHFARLVVFTGHASQTTNNPFDASLDCGACAGNPGGPSARVLAAICNDEAVRGRLAERGIEVPDDTVFLAAEHNTTTDEVELFDADVPASHADDVEQLRADLETARAGAAAERAGDMGAGIDANAPAATDAEAVRETERRAADWAETRPEWGLAGNAGFVIGPRELTDDLDLDGRAFLHSYDWTTDAEGDALEAILTGPLVVTQWINAQYYFATVDNAFYGSGSKVTHNPVGNVGVYQGNGGDLMGGLPEQSLFAPDGTPYHQPLRLSTVVHAPADQVEEVLAEHPEVCELLDNEWLSLTVVDPTHDHRALEYAGNLEWEEIGGAAEGAEPAPAQPAVADD